MAFLEWHEEYTVGNEEMDKQHQHLFHIVNDLHNAIFAKKGKEELLHTLDRLVEFTKSHFADEERVMLANGDPRYQIHKGEHEMLIKQASEMGRELRKSGSSFSPDALAFLVKDCLIGHILYEDKKSCLAAPCAQSDR